MLVDQVYMDKDSRMEGRYVRIVATNGGRMGDKAVCVPCDAIGHRHYLNGTKTTTISKKTLMSRFQFVGYVGNDREFYNADAANTPKESQ